MARTLHSLHSIDVAPGDIGVTVRRGFKWADALPGEHLELCVCLEGGHQIEGTGTVQEVTICRFKEIPARFVEHEHELSSRCYSGLLASMRKAYGEEFTEDDWVVTLTYRRES